MSYKNSAYTKRLSTDKTYKKPKTTEQESLTVDEIKNKLSGYQQVDDIKDVPIDTHIRYFTIDENGEKHFRLGGFLYKKNDDYIVLNNGKNTWSVQIDGAIFFRKLSQKEVIDEIHKSYQEELKLKDIEIKKLKLIIKKMKETVNK
jgi:hypothetical protein